MTAMILLLTCANFHNSAGQYERQFKKWGFRKNLTGEEWTTVSRRIDRRKRDGKETELRISGVCVPVKKRQKALARYGQGSTLEMMNYKHQHGKVKSTCTHASCN